MSRTYDTDVLTIRTTYVYTAGNTPYSTLSLPSIGAKGLLTWSSPDEWASTIYISSLRTSLQSIFSNAQTIHLNSNISTSIQTSISTQKLASEPYVNAQISLARGRYRLIDAINIRDYISTYTTVTSTLTTSSIHLQKIGTLPIGLSSFVVDLSNFVGFQTANSRIRFEMYPNIETVQNSLTSYLEPIVVKYTLKNQTETQTIGYPIITTYSNPRFMVSQPTLTWDLPASSQLSKLFSSIVLHTEVSSFQAGSVGTYRMTMDFPEAAGATITVNNLYAGTHIL